MTHATIDLAQAPIQRLRAPVDTKGRPSRFTVGIAALYLASYMSAVRPVFDESLCVLLLPVLVLTTLREFQKPTREVLVCGAALLLLAGYYLFISQQIHMIRASVVYVISLVYCFSLKSIRTPKGLLLLGIFLGAFFVASMGIMLLTVWFGAAANIRGLFYPLTDALIDNYTEMGFSLDAEAVVQGGLKLQLHEFGYQMAAGITFVLCLPMAGPKWLRSTWPVLIPLSVLLLVMTGQRSTVVAVAAGLAVFAVLSKRLSKLALLGGAVVFVVVMYMEQAASLGEFRKYNLLTRIERDPGDLSDRLQLQFWTLRQIPNYPLGLEGAGITYAAVAPHVPGLTRLTAPHNGYLTRTLLFGWPVMGLIVFLLWRLGKVLLSTARNFRSNTTSEFECVAFVSLFAVMVNALFHNASIATFQEETLVLLFLFVTAGSVTARLRATRHA